MKRDTERGFTLVELVFGVVLMAMMVAAISDLFLSNLQTVTLGKARAIGLALANEKMEALRDLPYDSLATQLGAIYPPGGIVDDETTARGGYTFKVHTDITYVDDPYDGYITCPCTGGPANGKPKDLYPYDYKKAQISVVLKSNNRQVAVLTSDVAGKAAETSSNTGILSITVVKANGQPVPNAVVRIVNTNPTPDVDITTSTDNQGLVVVPRLPPDTNHRYVVSVSYSGYSSETTIAEPAGSQDAVLLNPNVLVQQITSLTFAIDQLSTLYVHAQDTSGAALSGLAVTTRGAKKTRTNPDVFKYSQTNTTDASGNIATTGIEWDSYSFSLPAGYYLVSASPYAPVGLDPNTSQSVTLVVSTNSSWPRITSVEPVTAQTGTVISGFDVFGAGLNSGTTLTLRKSGESDISGTSCVSLSGNTNLSCDVNLTGAVAGIWDVVVTRSGNTTVQTGGFIVSP